MISKKAQVVILLLLTIFVGYLVTKQTGLVSADVRNFAVKDTASITKIVLTDKHNNSILLKRKQGKWIVNNKGVAQQKSINLLLGALFQVRVKEPVSKALLSEVTDNFSNNSTQVEIYEKNKLLKIIHVSSLTDSQHGTCMVLENSVQYFIMEVPWFSGDFSDWFSAHEARWSQHVAISVRLNDIKQVTVEQEQIKESFKVLRQDNKIELYNYDSIRINQFDTAIVEQFLMEFRHKSFAKCITDMPNNVKDSILQSIPMCIITVDDTYGDKHKIRIFRKPSIVKTDFFGNSIKYDPDYFVMALDNDKQVYARYKEYSLILRRFSDFVAR